MIKRILRSSIATVAMLAVGIALIGFGSVRGIRAELTEQTRRDWIGQMELNHVYTELYEDGASTDSTLLEDLAAKRAANEFVVGMKYDKQLAVHNTSSDVPQYARVTVYRYWTDGEGKRVDLDPELIDLEFATGSWQKDAAASTAERTVLYYTPVLAANAVSDPFITAITIDSQVQKEMVGKEYKYKGLEFHVEAVVDAIQTHHHADAMNGVWGTAYGVSE